MRTDLLDAKATIKWGESQIPVLDGRFISWNKANVELATVELDPQTGKKAKVLREKEPLWPIIHAEVGAIIGSFRSALNLLAASLAKRNGVTPSRHTHFPIFYSLHDFIDPLHGIEGKEWLSPAEIRIIKSLNPYDGGNDFIWAIHQLDILRKHERLIATTFRPAIWSVIGHGLERGKTFHPGFRRLEHETILFEFTRDTPEPSVTFTLDITFNERELPFFGDPVIPTLRKFAGATASIVNRFDA